MIHRLEARAVFGKLAEVLRAGETAAVATVVALRGSGYRRPGARMLVLGDGHRAAGGISAGCLEEDVRLHAVEATRDGAPRLLRYNTSAMDSFGLGLGCDGEIEVLVRPYSSGDAQKAIAISEALQGRRAVRIEDRVAGVTFVETVPPAPRLLICGTGPDSEPLAALATRVGFDVLVEGARVLIPPELGPDHFAIVKTHRYESDRKWLESLLATRVSYIGLVGSRRRAARLCEDVGEDERIYGPVGLDIGADGAEQIAVAIVAELLAVRSGCHPAHLRERLSTARASEGS